VEGDLHYRLEEVLVEASRFEDHLEVRLVRAEN